MNLGSLVSLAWDEAAGVGSMSKCPGWSSAAEIGEEAAALFQSGPLMTCVSVMMQSRALSLAALGGRLSLGVSDWDLFESLSVGKSFGLKYCLRDCLGRRDRETTGTGEDESSPVS